MLTETAKIEDYIQAKCGGQICAAYGCTLGQFCGTAIYVEAKREARKMQKITVKIDGMMCGMCEAHVNDAVRKAFPVKKVTSSHSKGETVILTEQDINETALRSAINATGYEVKAVDRKSVV